MANRTTSRQGIVEDPPAQPTLIQRQVLGLRQQLADPLVRNGYALIATSGVTGALGLVYWLLVARLYPAADVGRASAAYAVMNLLAGLTALNFNGVLNRFIPQAGRHTRTLILRAYAVSATASVCATIVFLLTLRWWGASYSELGGPLIGLIFIGAVVAWAIFTLQDSVLVGLRSASWVFVENGAFGLIKIVLLVLLVLTLPRFGIYISWMLPVIVAVPLVNALIFGRLVPRHTLLTADRQPPTTRQIGRFLAGDYAGAVCLLSVNLVPVLVAVRIGNAQSIAYFYVAWTISSFLYLLGLNMAMSLTVEGAFDASSLAANCRSALRKMVWILVPCVGLVALFAPLGLKLFGSAYAAHGTVLLELLAVAKLPSAATELYLGALRAQSRTSLVALIQAIRAVLMLGLTVILVGLVGTVGAGIAVFASQSAVALLISVGLWRVLTSDRAEGVRISGGLQGVLASARAQRVRISDGLRRVLASDRAEEVRISGGLQGALAVDRAGRAPTIQGEDERAVTGAGADPPPGNGFTFAPPPRIGSPPARTGLSNWSRIAAIGAVAAVGLALFFASLPGIDLARMNGLGLISVLPVGAMAGVALLALALMLGLLLPRAQPVLLGAVLAGLVICLHGITVFIEPEPRFATAYQILGYVNYVSTTGHTAPGLAAYFSWPGFFALVSFLAGAAGTHGLLGLLRVWPMVINLLYLPPLFLIMRNLRLSWRARWLAGFLFVVGNWVGQDYFSPQAFNYLLYLVFLAILVNWFVPDRTRPPHVVPRPWPARLHRRLFGIVRPGELPPQPASTGQKVALLALLIAIFTVSTASHQLTPFFMIGACAALVLVRRCTLTGLAVLLGVILAGWISFAAVGYWSGHISNIFGGIGALGTNLTSSVGGRLVGSTPTHLLALHARIASAAVIVGLAGVGLLIRRRRGLDDRFLLAVFCMPFFLIAVLNYGGEAALRIFLFVLPAACPLAACAFFPDRISRRPTWWEAMVLVGYALILPALFFLARYGNEAFEQTPPGEVAAANWVYAHDAKGVRLLWLSTAPETDVTPQMPWSYQDISKVVYVPALAPRDPARVAGLVSTLRSAGPGSYLIATQTQLAAMQQTASYPPGWEQQFRTAMSAAPRVRVAFANRSAVVYTLHWPRGTPRQPLPGTTTTTTATAGSARNLPAWAGTGLVVLWLLLALLAAREFIRVWRPAAPQIRVLTLTSLPLLLLLLSIIITRFVALS